jgi:hypothetical protein
MRINLRNLPKQSNSDLLMEHLEDFFTRTPLKQFTMHIQTSDRLGTSFGWPKIQRRVFGRIVFPCFRTRQDNMFYL